MLAKDAKQPEKKPPEVPMSIPDLAGEAAKEARRGRSGVSRQERPTEAHAVGTPRKEEANGGQRAVLASVLTELEKCRDMLRAAATPEGEPTKKPRGEQRRGLQA